MHLHHLLLLSLSALVTSTPLLEERDTLSERTTLEERNSYPWVSAYDNDNTDCSGNPPASQPYVKLRTENRCYGFAPTLNNIGWSWGAGTDFTVSRIKFYSDPNCEHALLWADMSNVTSKHGYCLPTKEYQADFPQWNPSNPPILSIMAGSDSQ